MVGSLFSKRPLETISSGKTPWRIFDLGLRQALPFCWASSCSFLSAVSSGGGATYREAGRAGWLLSKNSLPNAGDSSTWTGDLEGQASATLDTALGPEGRDRKSTRLNSS